MNSLNIPTWYYQQFDADYSLDVPAEGYGGWKQQLLPLNSNKTAVVVMHAWDCGTYQQFPGWYKAVEYIPRANAIASEIFPDLLKTIRKSEMKLFHVADDSGYADNFEGYKETVAIYNKHFDPIISKNNHELPFDSVHNELLKFKKSNSFVGIHNEHDVNCGLLVKSFLHSAVPTEGEPIAVNSDQLYALCLEYGINHLIYVGFAINWCLQYSPGNMNDMTDRGLICSTIREAVTAVENKESARSESHKEYGLWVTALKNGFVYDLKDFTAMLKSI